MAAWARIRHDQGTDSHAALGHDGGVEAGPPRPGGQGTAGQSVRPARARHCAADTDRQAGGQLLAIRRGELFFTMMAALVNLERDIILERTMAASGRPRLRAAAGRPPWTPTSW